MKIFDYLRVVHNDFKAGMAKRLRAKEVVRVLSVAHAQELKNTPIELWQSVQQTHRERINAVMAGKLDIIDRRSFAYPYLPECYSKDTEILTKNRGWIFVSKMKLSDKLATRSEEGLFEWQHPDKITRHWYEGKLLHFSGLKTDILVTPNHRMLGRISRRNSKSIIKDEVDIIKAYAIKELKKEFKTVSFEIPVDAKWIGKLPKTGKIIKIKYESESYKIDLKDWVRFLALYLSEGSCEGSRGGERKYNPFRVRIAQLETSPYFKDFVRLLNKLPFDFKYNGKSFESRSEALWHYVHPFGNSREKYIPKDLKELPIKYLWSFIRWYKKTDAHSYGKDLQYTEISTSSKRLAGDLQEILRKLGKLANYGERTYKNTYSEDGTQYRIHLGTSEYVGTPIIESVRYKNYVYCPTVKNSIVLVRRNGKVAWCGNSVHRLQQPILKNVPYQIRRFSETPIPRRAINLIKNSIVMTLRWEVRENSEVNEVTPDIEKRIRIATKCFKHPNRQDSWRTFSEKVIEDIILGGYGCFEPRITPDAKRPIMMWPVDGSSIRLYPDWTESMADVKPRYAQMTGMKGERGIIAFYDKELVYIKDNSRSCTPFGLGKMEVAFQMTNYFLGSQDAAGKAGADQIHKTMLWWNAPQQNANMQTVRRYITNELEGQSKISLLAGMPKPELVDIKAVTPEDLLLEWQSFQIKIIGAAFDISPISLNMTEDVNKAVGKVMSDQDFMSAVVPMAIRLAEAYTNEVLHKRLGWEDLEFVFLGLEDPDQLTKATIQQRKYQMNAITPDEIREDEGKPPIEGGWGRLTMSQYMILIAQATAMARGTAPGGGTGMPGMGQGGGFSQGQLPQSTGGVGSGMGIGAGFSTDDIAQMSPEDIEWLQQQGLLPETDDLTDQMEQQAPGILQTLTQQLKDFFDVVDEIDEEGEAHSKPSKVSKADEKEQLKKFKKAEHIPTYMERVLNTRYSSTQKDKNNKATKRFPRELSPVDRKASRS